MRRSAALLALLAASPALATSHKVMVDGKAYRVEVHKQRVQVFAKSFLTIRSPELRDQMRAAVPLATGCSVRDDYWQGTSIVGALYCAPTKAE